MRSRPAAFMRSRRGLVEQHAIEGPADFENIFGIHQHGGVAQHLRNRGHVGCHYRRVVRHGLQRRQPKTFVERWEDEDFCQS